MTVSLLSCVISWFSVLTLCFICRTSLCCTQVLRLNRLPSRSSRKTLVFIGRPFLVAISLMVEGKSSESIDPLSQKRCAFVVSSVQGKIDFCYPPGQDAVCFAHSVSPWTLR